MKTNSKNKKAQGLPLNTIVIAMLVIIVLLIIIVFFTKGMGDSNETINQNSPAYCGMTNSVLTTAGYKHVEPVNYNNKADKDKLCDAYNTGWTYISMIPDVKNKEGDVVKICCGTKED